MRLPFTAANSVSITASVPPFSIDATGRVFFADQVPYGLPFIAGAGATQVAIIPATADGVIAQGALALKQYASSSTLAKLPESVDDFDAGTTAFIRAIAVHELGHALIDVYGIQARSFWANEFLATYFAYAFLRSQHPDLAVVFELYAYDLNNESPGPAERSLQRLETLYVGVGPDDYAWYQGMFVGLAMQLYDELGLELLSKMKDAFPISETAPAPGNPDGLDEEFALIDSFSTTARQWWQTSFQGIPD